MNRGSQPQHGNQPRHGGGEQHGLASSVAETAGQVKDKVQDMASGAGERMEQAWESTRRGVQDAAFTAAQTAETAWDNFTGVIRRYPAASVCVAFCLGCLAAELFSLRLSDDMTRRMSHSSYQG
jgi:hypothetical protein